MTFTDPFKDAPPSPLHMLDYLCAQRNWRLRLGSDGTKGGDAQSKLTVLSVVRRAPESGHVAWCELNDTITVQTAARAMLIEINRQEREARR